MLNAKSNFVKSIARSRDLAALHEYLSAHVIAPFAYDDLLRYQLVHVVSAFDMLLHDLIRIGMVETFVGRRAATDRYHAEPISINLHSQLIQASFPPKEVLFEQEIIRKLRFLSFQDPPKVVDGLSLIWNEKHKWKRICKMMNHEPTSAKTKLKLIVARRNAIVHEADIDPISGEKTVIDPLDCTTSTEFVALCGCAIADLIIAN